MIEKGEVSFAILVENLGRMTEAIETLGQNVTQRAIELNELEKLKEESETPNTYIGDAKKIIKLTSIDMDQFVARMENEIPIFSESYSAGIDAIARAATIFVDFGQDEKELLKSLSNVRSIKGSLLQFLWSL